jgi:DNA-directed RNA polymerase subunit N (RpoN/RPB10)
MLESIKCSCNKSIGDLYIIGLELKKKNETLDNRELFKILSIDKECCKIKFLTTCNNSDYMMKFSK